MCYNQPSGDAGRSSSIPRKSVCGNSATDSVSTRNPTRRWPSPSTAAPSASTFHFAAGRRRRTWPDCRRPAPRSMPGWQNTVWAKRGSWRTSSGGERRKDALVVSDRSLVPDANIVIRAVLAPAGAKAHPAAFPAGRVVRSGHRVPRSRGISEALARRARLARKRRRPMRAQARSCRGCRSPCMENTNPRRVPESSAWT